MIFRSIFLKNNANIKTPKEQQALGYTYHGQLIIPWKEIWKKMDPVALNKTPMQSNNPTSSTSNSVNENVIHNSMQNHPIINFNNCTVNFGVGSSSSYGDEKTTTYH